MCFRIASLGHVFFQSVPIYFLTQDKAGRIQDKVDKEDGDEEGLERIRKGTAAAEGRSHLYSAAASRLVHCRCTGECDTKH